MKTVKEVMKPNAKQFAEKNGLSSRTVANIAKNNPDAPMFKHNGQWHWGKAINNKGVKL